MYVIAYIQNLVNNGSVVSEKSKFHFLNVNGMGQVRYLYLDLQYSHTFINSISCLHLHFRSQAAIVSEISTVFTFSYTKAYVTKFDHAVK